MDYFKSNLRPRHIIIRIAFAIIAALFISRLKLDYIEGYFFDLRVTLQSLLRIHKPEKLQSVIILINSKTIETYQGDPKFKDHLKLINLISSQNPKTILYEFRISKDEFVDITGTDTEKKEFAEMSKSFPQLYFSTQNLKMKGVVEELKMKPPLDSLKLISLPITDDSKLYGKDGVTRRLMFQYQDQSMGFIQLAAYYNPEILNLEKIKGQFNILESRQTYIHFQPKGTFTTYNFEDVIQQKIPKNVFENKIVIIGTDLGRSSKEYVLTPYSREITAMTNAELQANHLQTLIDNSSPTKAHKSIDFILTMLVTIITVYVTLSLKPFQGLIILVSLLSGITLINTTLFVTANYWLDLAHPFLSIFLCYYFFIPYRLIQENRRSWEYYQKNKLLSQVEELKTNFISMMSHDLKTPIARIQGMTEVISNDQQPLSSPQREALDSIRSSSDDLLKFINAILQYGRIESEGVELHKQSKDVNQLLESVIKKYEFLAKLKKIKMSLELEPLFPVQVDPELIKQVFSNLIENAIKYSPEDSIIKISTREENETVLITIQDQGMGISTVDLPNIFMKFFRTHTVKTTTIKGSGLGLYLAKYFVELHQGEISVTSHIEQGSTFTVKLPAKI